MNYVLGIDIGTTHCKAVALASNGALLYECKSNYPTVQDLPGQSEQDAADVFNTMLNVLQQAVASINEHSLDAVCFSTAMHSVMAVDKQGTPLTKAYTWADTRSNEIAASLRDLPNATSIYDRTGTPIHPMSPLCKIAWIKKEMPQ